MNHNFVCDDISISGDRDDNVYALLRILERLKRKFKEKIKILETTSCIRTIREEF